MYEKVILKKSDEDKKRYFIKDKNDILEEKLDKTLALNRKYM